VLTVGTPPFLVDLGYHVIFYRMSHCVEQKWIPGNEMRMKSIASFKNICNCMKLSLKLTLKKSDNVIMNVLMLVSLLSELYVKSFRYSCVILIICTKGLKLYPLMLVVAWSCGGCVH
jgi:hypothetical protein